MPFVTSHLAGSFLLQAKDILFYTQDSPTDLKWREKNGILDHADQAKQMNLPNTRSQLFRFFLSDM